MSRFVSLAGNEVSELAVRAAEDGRFSRGRALFRKGSVADLSVSEGSIVASVRGSGGDLYEATIGTAAAPPGVVRQVSQAQDPEHQRSLDELIDDGLEICPRDIDLVFGCNCADWDEACKHVVAAILAFADRVDLDESELLRWRGIDLTALADNESTGDADTSTDGHPLDRVEAEAATDEASLQPRRWRPRRPGPSTGRAAEPSSGLADEHGADKPSVDGDGQQTGDRTATLSELEALLGDTVMRVPSSDDSQTEERPIDPGLAAFLGAGTTIEPVDVSTIPTPAPLFADAQLGPLADLGPALADALATVMARTDRF